MNTINYNFIYFLVTKILFSAEKYDVTRAPVSSIINLIRLRSSFSKFVSDINILRQGLSSL